MPNSSKYYHPDSDFLRKLGFPAPKTTSHGVTEEELDNLRQPLVAVKWSLKGNELIGTTADGVRYAQFISTDYILEGTDDKGLPILRKLV